MDELSKPVIQKQILLTLSSHGEVMATDVESYEDHPERVMEVAEQMEESGLLTRASGTPPLWQAGEFIQRISGDSY